MVTVKWCSINMTGVYLYGRPCHLERLRCQSERFIVTKIAQEMKGLRSPQQGGLLDSYLRTKLLLAIPTFPYLDNLDNIICAE